MRESDLHAYVDGQLDPARRIEVETWLTEDDEAVHRVEAYRAQNAALHRLFDSVLKEPLEGELGDLAHRLGGGIAAVRARRHGWTQPGWQRMAASIAFVAVGLGGGWFGHAQWTPVSVAVPERPSLLSFAKEATQAHTFYAHSRFEVEMGADDQEALNNWLSERLGRAVFGPDLTANGYRLKGGRSLPTDTGTVAQYMYESDDANRLTLFVGVPQAADQQAAFSFVKRGDIASFYWAEGALSYALVGRFERDQLMGIAQTVHQQLKSGPLPHQPTTQNPSGQNPKAVPTPVDPVAPTPSGADQGRPKSS